MIKIKISKRQCPFIGKWTSIRYSTLYAKPGFFLTQQQLWHPVSQSPKTTITHSAWIVVNIKSLPYRHHRTKRSEATNRRKKNRPNEIYKNQNPFSTSTSRVLFGIEKIGMQYACAFPMRFSGIYVFVWSPYQPLRSTLKIATSGLHTYIGSRVQ